jgi:RhtB (resistance to homoserine/threonine) family protein
MNNLTYWLLFLSAAVALNISPGPDLIYILSRSVAHGTRVGLASTAGVCTGAFVHVIAASLGLSAILAASSTAFTLVKYIGAIYLIYLGVQSIRTSGTLFNVSESISSTITTWQAFRQGVMVDVLNPKVSIFFMAFLPQFVREGHGSETSQLIVLGTLVICVSLVVESCFVFAATRATNYFRSNSSASVWLDRILGSVLIALGVRLARSE